MYEVIINKQGNVRTILLLENNTIVEKYEEDGQYERLEGNIYIGKVQNVLPGMQAAFVNIGEGRNTFIHLKDLLPKVDTKSESLKDEIEIKDIKKIIKSGMPLLVQVKKDSTTKKGARISTHISIPGRYIVFMPNIEFITISQKIEDLKEKERLINMVRKLLPKGSGAIVRTSSEGKDEITIKNDMENLVEQWEKIKKLEENTEIYPKLLYKNAGTLKKLFIDMIDIKIDKIIINDIQTHKEVLKILKDISYPNTYIELRENIDLIEEYYLGTQIEKIKNRKIWLNCGGFITIDRTEALTAIDVNSGKYIGTKDLEQTVYTVNKEATREIARQLRLKDIGGIVVIDYIDMEQLENRKKIEELLKSELKKDRSKTQVLGFTKLNLLEMTRKHLGNAVD